MRIITSHLGADFDALGAMAGALLLDPRASLVFAGSQEVAVRRFLETEGIHLPELRLRDVRRGKMESALVVDCSSARRLGEVGEMILASGCPVTVVDHHPVPEDALPWTERISAPVASTCTVLTQELRRRGRSPDPLTATLLLLGIYEDTGGLTYVDTTPDDLHAAGWMLELGARLEWVRRYVLRPLEPEQLDLLNALVDGEMEHRIGGVRVVISVARPDERVEEASYVVHRFAEIFDVPVVVAILEVPPQLVVIARSTTTRVDAARLLGAIGGGGHSTAAGARVRNRSAVEVAQLLLAEIAGMLGSELTAQSIATPYLHTCESTATVSQAKEELVRLRINALPVEKEGELIGVVTRQILDNAGAQGMGDRKVTTVMRPEVPVVAADTPLDEVERTFMEGQARLLVVRLRHGWGAVTRMDLFRRLYQRQIEEGSKVDRRVAGFRLVTHKVEHLLRRALSARVVEVLQVLGEVADELEMRAYLVGGAVRDTLLERPLEDCDVVVEGNGLMVAGALVERLGGHYHPHEPFLTAAVRLPDGIRIDVATARTEFYRFPAALPEVVSSALRLDMYRRDFTINAMAISLSAGRFGELLDFFGGQKDLHRRQIRVLHSLSFLDDPTRAIRAVRFALRLGFEIAAETRHLVRVAVDERVFGNLSGERLRDELTVLLEEENGAAALTELDRLDVFRAVVPQVRWSAALRRLAQEMHALLTWADLEGVYHGPRWMAYLAALAARAGERGGRELATRLALAGRTAGRLSSAQAQVEGLLAVASRTPPRPSEVLSTVERTDAVLGLVAMAMAGEEARSVIRQALTVWSRLELPVSGADLIARGVPAGPRVGSALRRTRVALLDGEIDAEAALDFALSVARGGRKGR
jgi:tRNA nucleotidyltransferase (CCA-adding enzyme)